MIIGGTKGLGKSLADKLRQEGARVLVSSRFESSDDSIIKADAKDESLVMNLAKIAIDKFGQIDIWINNAGIGMKRTPFAEADMKEVREVIEVNLFGVMYGSRAALVQMQKQNSGVIMNILSTSAQIGRVGEAAYCASKFGADGFTKSIRQEVENSNIKVIELMVK